MEKDTYLTFVLGKEYFAVNVKTVLEVLEEPYITPVPMAPEHILGIINFRGEIVPVADSRLKLNMPSLEGDVKNYVIIFEIGTDQEKVSIAATADAVKDVIEIDPEEIKPVPEMGITYDVRFISGVIRRDDKFILLMNIEKVFSLVEMETMKLSEVPKE
jgi:purine-binding chemotaxis protein CheW